MERHIYNMVMGAVAVVASLYMMGRRLHRRFCIDVLWRRFRIKTAIYRRWHDRRAAHLQTLLDNEHSSYPTF